MKSTNSRIQPTLQCAIQGADELHRRPAENQFASFLDSFVPFVFFVVLFPPATSDAGDGSLAQGAYAS